MGSLPETVQTKGEDSMRITYCDRCGAKITGEPSTVRISRPFPLFESIDREFEVCNECAAALQKKLPSELDKQGVMEIIGTVKVNREELVKAKVDEFDAYLASYKQGAEAALLEELKRAGAITYTVETGFYPSQPMGGGKYSASIDVVLPAGQQKEKEKETHNETD